MLLPRYSARAMRCPVLTYCVWCYLPTYVLCDAKYRPTEYGAASLAMRCPVLTLAHGATRGESQCNFARKVLRPSCRPTHSLRAVRYCDSP
eukprot:2767724-Rhodomonas_salina.6